MSYRTDVPLRVVLACAPEDTSAARAITQRLRVDGLLPWLAADELADQPDELRALRVAIAAADAVIFCLSRRSRDSASQLVPDIARVYDGLGLRQPPLGLQIALRLGVCDVPTDLAAAVVYDLFGYSGYERLLVALRGYAETLRQEPEAPTEPTAPDPGSPALLLRGRYALHSLERQGQALRLGRGCARSVIMLAADRALLASGGGAALIDIGDPRLLWSIDCPTRRAVLSPSGRLLALAGGAQIFLWDLQEGRLRS
ncbi:MAG: hypothetical protein HGA65_11840, partial [Oscillochloris sp.]|nr:hypothetical protein [Oscillochloris sp.]